MLVSRKSPETKNNMKINHVSAGASKPKASLAHSYYKTSILFPYIMFCYYYVYSILKGHITSMKLLMKLNRI